MVETLILWALNVLRDPWTRNNLEFSKTMNESGNTNVIFKQFTLELLFTILKGILDYWFYYFMEEKVKLSILPVSIEILIAFVPRIMESGRHEN